MAAAAGAPGSGEGGEAEPDSEPISGDNRPRYEQTEAPALHGPIVEELGWEKALDTEEAGHGDTGLRLAEPEELPECIGPEVTPWESEEQEPPAALQTLPEAWRDMEAQGVVDTGLEAMEVEEPMQLGQDYHCPSAPCHGGAALVTMAMEETDKSGGPPFMAEHPPMMCAPSPKPQVTSDPVHLASEPVLVVAPEVQILQELEFALMDHSPQLEDPHVPLADSLLMQVFAPLDPEGSPCTTMEEVDAPPRVETPDVFLQVQESSLESEDQIAPLPNEEQALVMSGPEVASAHPEVASAHPEVASAHPEVASAHPEVASAHPEVASAHPEVASAHPEVASAHPEVASAHPEVASAHPEVASAHPEVASAHPEVASAHPEVASAHPEVASAHPEVASAHPEVASAHPEVASAHPEVASAHPEVASAHPEVASAHPEVASAHPEVASAHPEVASAHPEVASAHPEVASAHPEVASAHPEVASAHPEVASAHPEVASNLQEEIPCTVDDETIVETQGISRSAQIVAISDQELCTEVSDLPQITDSKSVPAPFQLQEEEQIGDLEVVEDTKAHPESREVTVEVFFQGSERGHHSDGSVPLMVSDSLEDAAMSPMDSGISSELTSAEKELDSQSSHVETEQSVDSSSDYTKLVSYCQDVEYDPFYRDTKMEDSSTTKAIVVGEEECQVSVAPVDVVQTVDSAEEPVPLPSSKAEADACKDNPDPLSAVERLVAGGIDDLVPGSEVQVTLDHIIQDALVVSFRHGDRIFSGVLMDLSKRFGPHGIPVTVHPKREYKNKPEEPVQPQSTSFQEESSLNNENGTGPMDVVSPIQSPEPCGVNNNNLWTSKPPPLFHEGAPYPPPLFIRDTYNQSIPQPPPRKIKRLKKKIYREEPTSIMNAIKLRPRQVLCDKCKNVVADKREVRKTGSDSFKLEEGKRRRHESVTTVNKKLKTDHKVNGKSQSEGPKKNPVSKVSTLAHGRGKVVKVASQTHASKAHLHTKKVLQSKNMDHAKAREVLKLAKEKAQKKQKETSSSKNAHGKVHFTRRLQNTTSGTLPPRLRIKPQRYRNEENDSSLKIGLDSLRSSKIGIKPQTRYTATRSAGEAPSEIKTPPNGPEEVSSAIETASVCVPPGEQEEQQALSKRGSKSDITVYMTLNQKDSSSASVCSSDSTDDLKSTHSECSSTENFDFPPGSMHAPSSSSSSSSSKEEKKLSNSLKIKVFSKNVSKCMTPDGRTICVGDIVWAKIYGFPWWPARILTITISRKDNGLLVRQEASISWFGSPTTSFLALSQLSPFLENFQSRFNKKRKGLYRKAITEAAKAAKQLTPEVRALLTQFET